jgi:hypothetical protein
MSESILTAENVQQILKVAKENLMRDGAVQPVLFLHLTTGEHLVTPVELSGTTQDKIRYINHVGFSLWQSGKVVAEAIMLAEGWFVSAKESGLDLTVPPSQHPERREALVLIGRDADRTRITSVVQPFNRDENGKPVWQALEMTAFNTPPSRDMQMVGLLDYFFVPVHRREPA